MGGEGRYIVMRTTVLKGCLLKGNKELITDIEVKKTLYISQRGEEFTFIPGIKWFLEAALDDGVYSNPCTRVFPAEGPG